MINFLIKYILFFAFSVNIAIAEQMLSLDDNFFPEGIAISKNGDIFVGSLKENKIVRFKNNEKKSEIFVPSNSNSLNSVIGIIADNRNKILWACSSNPGVSNYPSDKVVSLKAFDINTGDFIQSYEFPNGGFCNDITLDSNGNVYATDSFNPRILRLNKSQSRLETWYENDDFKGEGFNLNGITFIDNKIYTVKMNSGELFEIEVADNGKPINYVKIDLPRPLNAPDGIKAIDKNNLLVVENKGSLTNISLSDPIILNVIKDNLDTPTTVAIKGKTAWVLQAQFGHLFGDEKDIPPGPFEIIGVQYKPSILTKIKKLLNFEK
ncbi:MAG: hypothetical protein CFH26_00370 [Alphaproteobacteria bacterium MarineAlpha6_Bin4]|nr:MAG: hypothetical protein CFH25_00391 [Alphaproteobacteria bacterium MarineAlpha6_Bin3]PPR38011.1 MAG: hypothetical protein CFH26_00370 [Alphaproteobacteria bacterium MarineAlpha6_Bin4]|tara:strand:- start:3644 stop:4609 length:966 start_codon:yes stop_codon:yes gene_type:complete